ncbi:MAG: hypothetical protein JKX68_05745 [Flavobacteriales bacterium]|nr:hypothetical protein [Flavobacteriales bacterium]
MNKVFILFACITTLFVGCNSDKQEKNNDHGHAHIDPLAYTIYSDQSELFVEFKPLVVGETSKFAAHFTKLGENFTAIEEGSVSLKLIGKKGQPSFKSEAPSSPGIFRLKLKPINTGKYKLVFYINTKTYSDTITIENVIVHPNEKVALANPQESNIGEEIVYLKEQAWKVEFANVKVVKQPFAEIIKTTGHILPAQGDEVIITAKNNGIITFGNNKKLIGSAVNAGETMFSITGGGLTENNIDNDFKNAKASFEKNKADYERAQNLIKGSVISQKEFQEIELRYKNAQINYNNMAKNYSSNGKKIISPIKGFIKKLTSNRGSVCRNWTTHCKCFSKQKVDIKS